MKATVLLVEDDYALALGTAYSLKAEDYDVVQAKTIKEARTALDREMIDIVLLDVMLPDGDGYAFCQELRAQHINVPIIFLTAVANEANIVQGLDMGADDYVTKPFRVKELMSRIHALLRRQSRYANEDAGLVQETRLDNHLTSDVFVCENYKMDLNQHRIYRDGTLVDCTPSEIRLLRELMLHSGQVVTREQLMERLWDIEGNFVYDNTLSVYIKRLRDKLPELREHIRTVRGVGYEFVTTIEKQDKSNEQSGI
jgi:DNA-binding response OmpR family regulator